MELCRALGHEPVPGEHVLSRYGSLAGHDQERLEDLNAALADTRVDAVWCVRGGYGVTRILPRVDFAAFARRPKPVVGYSDITALLNALTHATGVVTFHGPTARHALTGFSRTHLERVLVSATAPGRLGRPPAPPDVLVPATPRIITIVPGRAEGVLIGGNLTLLQCLVGTPWQPAFDGALLFLEDVGEDLYRIDRALSHLRLAGLLDRLAGVVAGQFTCMRRATSDGGLGFDEVLASYFEPLGVPTASGFPIGHVDHQWTLPIGVKAALDADSGEVELLEQAVT